MEFSIDVIYCLQAGWRQVLFHGKAKRSPVTVPLQIKQLPKFLITQRCSVASAQPHAKPCEADTERTIGILKDYALGFTLSLLPLIPWIHHPCCAYPSSHSNGGTLLRR